MITHVCLGTVILVSLNSKQRVQGNGRRIGICLIAAAQSAYKSDLRGAEMEDPIGEEHA